MPKLIPLIITRTESVATDIVNFVVRKKPGIRLTAVGRLFIAGAPRVGAAIARTVGELFIGGAPRGGVAVDDNVTGTTREAQDSGAACDTTASGSASRPISTDGARIASIEYSLNRDGFATSAFATGDWEDENNSTGSPDGSLASMTGGLASRSGSLINEFATIVGKDELEIQRVEIRAWHESSGTTVASTSFQIRLAWFEDGVRRSTPLTSFSGNRNRLNVPDVFTVTDTVPWDWEMLGSAEVEFIGDIGAGGSGVAWEIDAVAVHVEATKTDTI